MTDEQCDQGIVISFHSVYECCKCAPNLFILSLSLGLSGLHGSRRDVSGRRDSRNESDEGPEAAAHAAVAGIETPPSHSRPPPPPPPRQQDHLEPAESHSLLFLCIDVVHDLYIHVYLKPNISASYVRV